MICCLVRDSTSAAPPGALEAIARACSPRVESHGQAVVVFDATGLARVLGPPADIARDVSQLAARQGLTIRVALAATTTAAWLLAHARPGTTVVRSEATSIELAGLPIRWLATLPDRWTFSGPGPRAQGPGSGTHNTAGTGHLALGTGKSAASARHYRMAPGPSTSPGDDIRSRVRGRSRQEAAPDAVFDLLTTLERWGLRTLGDVARLPRADVHARLGLPGVRVHQAASGEDTAWLVPAEDAPRFVERRVLDWPIEGLEPLSFALARLLEDLSTALERADRGAVEVATRLQLVTRESHERVLHLPAPLRDARVLRTLILLDLESHPPPAGIDIVEVELGVAPGRIVQGTLLRRALPSPEDLSTLIARLGALMGDTRVGAPVVLDTHDDRPVSMRIFDPCQGRGQKAQGTADDPFPLIPSDLPPPLEVPSSPVPSALCPSPCTALRRFRLPVAARVTVERGAPVHVSAPAVAAGEVVASAGPWRSSGAWWALDRSGWDRDEWDVELDSGACYRLARDRPTGRWEIEGQID